MQFELGGTMLAPKQVPVSVMDLGKMLLHCSREGETSKVRELLGRGAPFTTDWVRLNISKFRIFFSNCVSLFTSWALPRSMWPPATTTTTPAMPCYELESVKTLAPRLIERRCTLPATKVTTRLSNCCWRTTAKWTP